MSLAALPDPDDRTEVIDAGQLSDAELANDIRDLLVLFREQLRGAWEIAAQIGDRLKEVHRRVGEEGWPAWLQENGLTVGLGFLLLRAHAHRDLLDQHRPQSTYDLAKMLRPALVEGAQYDREMCAIARRWYEGGMTKRDLRINLAIPDSDKETLTRWLEPEKYREKKRRQAEKRAEDQRRAEAREAAAFIRSVNREGKEGGPALDHVAKARPLTDAAWRSETDREKKAAFGEAYELIAKAEQLLRRALS